ncbi:diaminopimelate decarboxylase [Marivirga arenosa]|uniref:Diaminopimelate decarboxylase n=1 Tax=Marivirga arenosa TaxID=3059076 RepID=A0AA51ZWP7_9BACT|nr:MULTISPECIES: diaminopimelate decarboxylase [unclassified Marivirga]WMN07651.1 diaminopimelate decarboxylase [Marivirga sp. ABR2-2]WNB18134.1 diaminopimelate decarboxylase [Marivirga sp. BKB1-2]
MDNKFLTSLTEKYGTPLYVYDADKIASQIKRLNDAFSGINLKLKYATKALSNISVLKWMKKHGTGLDVVSIQEAYLGLKAGFEPKDILYTPNCVSIDEIVEAVDLGLMINIDNISILEQFGHKYHNSVPVCIRLNPHIMAGGNSKISTGHIDSKFGISILQMRHLLRVIENYNINVIGLHIHTGSDILDSEVFLRGTEIIFEAAEDFPDIDFIDFGSGFKVAYKEGDVTTDIEELGKEVSKRFKDFCKSRGKDLELWFEPGKFLVSEAGYFLSKVNVIKTTPATVFVGLDTGMNHLLRPMMYDAYHQIENISNPSDTQRVYTVVGYICETDTFGTDRRLSEVRQGDIIAIKNAGAYGFSMASNYNSRYRPAEVLVHEGKDQLIRKRESLDDLLRNQVIVDFE